MTREVDSIIAYNAAGATGCYAGYTTNGTHAPGSYHELPGTPSASGPIGLAVDFDALGNDPAKLLTCAQWFLQTSTKLFELFHTPLGFSIKAGRRVPWTIADHVTHVHVAVPRATFLSSAPAPPKPSPPVYGPIEQHGDTMQRQVITTGSLDSNGSGYVDTHIPWEKFVSLIPLGPSPDRDGYGWPNWYWSANLTDGQARVEVESGEPHKPVSFVAWRVD